MKKQLRLIKSENNYILKSELENEKQVVIENKTIDGEKIYENFYSDFDIEVSYEIITDLTDRKDKIIYNQLTVLFKKIDAAIKNIRR